MVYTPTRNYALDNAVSSSSDCSSERSGSPSSQEAGDRESNQTPKKQTDFAARSEDTPLKFTGTSAGSGALHPSQSHVWVVFHIYSRRYLTKIIKSLRDPAFRQVEEDMKNFTKVHSDEFLKYFSKLVSTRMSTHSQDSISVPPSSPSASSVFITSEVPTLVGSTRPPTPIPVPSPSLQEPPTAPASPPNPSLVFETVKGVMKSLFDNNESEVAKSLIQ